MTLTGLTEPWLKHAVSHTFCNNFTIAMAPFGMTTNYLLISDMEYTIINMYFSFQVKGHQRIPSGSGAQEFKENTKRDALHQLKNELDKLIQTAPECKRDYLRKQYDGYSYLFERFLQEEGPSVEWDKIEKLPPDAVNISTVLLHI